MYQCINKSIATTNYQMRLDDFEIKINCNDGVNSGAQNLAAGAIGAATLVAASLYWTVIGLFNLKFQKIYT